MGKKTTLLHHHYDIINKSSELYCQANKWNKSGIKSGSLISQSQKIKTTLFRKHVLNKLVHKNETNIRFKFRAGPVRLHPMNSFKSPLKVPYSKSPAKQMQQPVTESHRFQSSSAFTSSVLREIKDSVLKFTAFCNVTNTLTAIQVRRSFHSGCIVSVHSLHVEAVNTGLKVCLWIYLLLCPCVLYGH